MCWSMRASSTLRGVLGLNWPAKNPVSMRLNQGSRRITLFPKVISHPSVPNHLKFTPLEPGPPPLGDDSAPSARPGNRNDLRQSMAAAVRPAASPVPRKCRRESPRNAAAAHSGSTKHMIPSFSPGASAPWCAHHPSAKVPSSTRYFRGELAAGLPTRRTCRWHGEEVRNYARPGDVPPRADGLDIGQELGPHEETGSRRKAREPWEFYGRIGTCCLHRRAPLTCTEEERGHARYHHRIARRLSSHRGMMSRSALS